MECGRKSRAELESRAVESGWEGKFPRILLWRFAYWMEVEGIVDLVVSDAMLEGEVGS